MDVIDGYFRTLRIFLPNDQREDIIRELSEEIRSQVAEKEAGLGRLLNADETAAIVGQYGHPLLTAARYWPQRYLIGPVIFPYYWSVLKVVLGIIVVAHVIGATVMLVNDAGMVRIGAVLENAISTALKALGWITLLAAGADFCLKRSGVLEKWKPPAAFPPAALHASEIAQGAIASALRGLPRTHSRHSSESRSTPGAEPSVSGFVISLVVGAWWLAGLKVPAFFFGPGAVDLDWGPAMDRLYPVLVVAQVTMLVEQFVWLTRTETTGVFRVTRVVWLIAGWTLIYLVATSNHQWMVWQGEAAARGNSALMRLAGREISLSQLVNYVWSTIFILVAVTSVWASAKALIGRIRGTPGRAAAALAGSCALATTLAGQTAPAQPSPLSDVDVRRILVDRIDAQKQSLGIVVGIVTPAGKRVVPYGVLDRHDSRPVDGDTVFEIGSVTKVFTSWLLADMARRGDVSLTDAIARYLPPGRQVKSTSDGRTITLTDLATHTAGLPFWPSNVPATGDTTGALAGYTVEQLFDFISAYEIPADIGSRWAYSNIDAGLLGVLLARRAGSTYDALLSDRLISPFGMASTGVVVSADMRTRLTPGHDVQLKKATPWNVPALVGGGSLHSTANDLLTFLAALDRPESTVAAALPTMLHTRRKAPGFQQALGWMMLAPTVGDEILFHDGQTLGFASSIAYEPATRTGVVVLSNTAAGVGDIARHVLRPTIPLAKRAGPAPQRTEIQVDPQLFDLYAGQYAPAPGTTFVVSRETNALMLQLPGLPKLRLRPESERDFFVAENTRISVTFEVDADRQVTRLLLRAPTGNVPAVRVER